jgi:EAL domain-containing protein (putative c-di-GMP-specific phosphodiesterase class I)
MTARRMRGVRRLGERRRKSRHRHQGGGVETSERLHEARNESCTGPQGCFFSVPRPDAALRGLFAQRKASRAA